MSNDFIYGFFQPLPFVFEKRPRLAPQVANLRGVAPLHDDMIYDQYEQYQHRAPIKHYRKTLADQHFVHCPVHEVDIEDAPMSRAKSERLSRHNYRQKRSRPHSHVGHGHSHISQGHSSPYPTRKRSPSGHHSQVGGYNEGRWGCCPCPKRWLCYGIIAGVLLLVITLAIVLGVYFGTLKSKKQT